ncbi:MAG: omptin family outer membrane protease, partial [bacterium]|nr:omptin family outer membrane protease [bacterium]
MLFISSFLSSFVFLMIGLRQQALSIYSLELDYSLGLHKYSGYIQYQIGGFTNFADGYNATLHFPNSELRFPFDIIPLEAQVNLTFKDRFKLSFSHLSNFQQQKAGILKDSDWLDSLDRKDVYSESTAVLHFLDNRIQAEYLLNKASLLKGSSTLFYLGIMYQEQNLSYTASELTQISPEDSTIEPIYVSGNVISYQTKLKAPYLVFRKKTHFDNFL